MSIVLKTFKFNSVDASGHALQGTRALYANGRQQVKMRVTLLKQVDGSNTPLTQTEKDSMTIVSYRGNGMPGEWQLSTIDNEYTPGLNPNRSRKQQGDKEQLTSSVRNKIQDIELYSNTTGEEVKDGEEVFYFYLSTADESSDPKDFEAIITLEGAGTYRSGEASFNYSYVTVQAYEPYTVDVSEINVEDEEVYCYEWKKGKYSTIRAYWFNLPSDLSIVEYNSQAPDSWSHSRAFLEFWGHKSDGLTYSSALHHDTTSFNVFQLGVLTNSNHEVMVDIPLRGAGLRGTIALNEHYNLNCSNGYCDRTYYSKFGVEVIDEYGCEHRYALHTIKDNYDLEVVTTD
ncbi:hypothetical protein [Vibrio hyugaensis]|uniref:hypothetical protein n=1 Tax=Vibrio hyugaensis TaxID=1534743 RepID=UPI000CE44E1D|nr:hypothetical protein [Vibrio hyugaensis]